MLYGDDSMSQEGFFELSEGVTVLLYLWVSLASDILQGPFRCTFTNV